ncbi:MAG: response regulator [Bacteroidota bacterium]
MIKVFIADDHHVVREGIVSLLKQVHDIKVIGEASDGTEAFQKIIKLNPDVAILDISMPEMNGLDTAKRLIDESYKGKILILTQYDKEEYVRLAMQIGVSGYLVKISIKQEVIDAIRAVMKGEIYFSPSVSKIMINEYLQKTKRKTIGQYDIQLTQRELEVLQYIAEGYSSRLIAQKLYVSLRTVEFHRANINQKLGIHDVAGLTRYAIKHGLVKID